MLLVLRVGDEFQVVRIPAGIDAASVVELSTFWDGTAKELPAEPVGVTVLSLGDAPVWRGRAHEAPTGAELGMGRFENGEIDQAFELGTAASELSAPLSMRLVLCRSREPYGSGTTTRGCRPQGRRFRPSLAHGRQGPSSSGSFASDPLERRLRSSPMKGGDGHDARCGPG